MRSYFDKISIQVKDKLIASQGFYRVGEIKRIKRLYLLKNTQLLKKKKLNFNKTFRV